jgi:hypothetical protein
MALLFTLFAFAAVWMGQHFWKVYRNYRAAKLAGLPIVVCPVDAENVGEWQ